jgi:hypothetical protein
MWSRIVTLNTRALSRPHMLGNDVAERPQVSGRQPLHHLWRLVEV